MHASAIDVLDNQGPILRSVPDESLRELAVEADASSDSLFDLASLWAALVTGRTIVAGAFQDQRRSLLVLRASTECDGVGLTVNQRTFLERSFSGQSQKAIAIEFGLSPSTVATTLGSALHALGSGVPASRAPMLLALAVHAQRSPERGHFARTSQVRHGGIDYRVLGTLSPDVALRSKLSSAERVVVSLRIEGLTHSEIACARKTSARTVANQLASAFRKLGVSGRSELLDYLARSEALVFRAGSHERPPELGTSIN